MKIKFSDGTICELIDTNDELVSIKDIKRRMAEAVIAIKDAEPLFENDEDSNNKIEKSENKIGLKKFFSQYIPAHVSFSEKANKHDDISISIFLDDPYARNFWMKKYPEEVMKKYDEGVDVRKAFEDYFMKPLVKLIENNLIEEKSDEASPKNLDRFKLYLNNIKERNFPYSLSGTTGLKNALHNSLQMIENYIYKWLHPEYSNRSGVSYVSEDVKSNLTEKELAVLYHDYDEYKYLVKKINETNSLEEKTQNIKELKSKIAEKYKFNKNGSDE